MTRQAAAISVFSLAATGLGAILQFVTAYHFGAGSDVDAFLVASAMPAVLLVVVSGSLNSILVPLCIKVRARDGSDGELILGTSILIGLTLSLCGLAFIGMVATRPVLELLMGSLSPATLSVALELSPVLWIAMVFNILSSFFSSLLQARERYILQALVPAVGVSVTISWILLRAAKDGVWALAIGTVAASALQLLLLMPVSLRYKPGVLLRTSYLFEAGSIGWPMLLSSMIVRSTPLLERSAASAFPAGTIARLNYASKLMNAALSITITGIAAVALPLLSKSADDPKRFRRIFMDFISSALFTVAPVVCLLVVFSDEIGRITYLHGSFTTADLAVVSRAMRLYSPVLLFGAIGAVVWKGFYAKQLTGTATAIDITGIALYGVLLIIGTRMAGIDGIALAMSGYFVALTIMAAVVFFKRAGFAMTDLESPMLLKIAVSSVSLLITGWIMRQLISQDSFIALAVITAAAALAYVVSARLLRVPEAVKVVGTLERVYAAASRYR